MPIRSYKDLLVWRKAMLLAADVERVSARLQEHRRFELSSQLRRCSMSIPSNIAEGWARPTKVYIQHLSIALGSQAELETQLLHLANVDVIPTTELEDLLERTAEVGRMLGGLMRSLRAHLSKRAP